MGRIIPFFTVTTTRAPAVILRFKNMFITTLVLLHSSLGKLPCNGMSSKSTFKLFYVAEVISACSIFQFDILRSLVMIDIFGILSLTWWKISPLPDTLMAHQKLFELPISKLRQALYMTHSQMLGKFEYTLPAKF